MTNRLGSTNLLGSSVNRCAESREGVVLTLDATDASSAESCA